MASGILSDDQLDRAEEAVADSRDRKARARTRWLEEQRVYGNVHERTRWAYSKYLSTCIELRRNERWLDACSMIQQLSGR